MMRAVTVAATLAFASLGAGCTFHHSRQAVGADLTHSPHPDSRFVTEDDSGLLILGLVSLSEPDHYSVLAERARRKHRCARLSQGQLDFYTDHWLLVAFPVSRLTLVCEPPGEGDHSGGHGH